MIVLPENLSRTNKHNAAHAKLRCQSFVVVVQATEFRKCDDPAPVWRMHYPRVRRIHREGEVRSPVVVVVEIPGNDAPEVMLVQCNNMVEAVAS